MTNPSPTNTRFLVATPSFLTLDTKKVIKPQTSSNQTSSDTVQSPSHQLKKAASEVLQTPNNTNQIHGSGGVISLNERRYESKRSTQHPIHSSSSSISIDDDSREPKKKSLISPRKERRNKQKIERENDDDGEGSKIGAIATPYRPRRVKKNIENERSTSDPDITSQREESEPACPTSSTSSISLSSQCNDAEASEDIHTEVYLTCSNGSEGSVGSNSSGNGKSEVGSQSKSPRSVSPSTDSPGPISKSEPKLTKFSTMASLPSPNIDRIKTMNASSPAPRLSKSPSIWRNFITKSEQTSSSPSLQSDHNDLSMSSDDANTIQNLTFSLGGGKGEGNGGPVGRGGLDINGYLSGDELALLKFKFGNWFEEREKTLLEVFRKMVDGHHGGSKMTREAFGKALGLLNVQPWTAFLFDAIDLNHDNYISFYDYATFMATVSVGTKEDRLRFGFRLLDLDKDGSASLEEVYMLFNSITLALQKLELNADLKHFWDDFCKTFEFKNTKLLAEDYQKCCCIHGKFLRGLRVRPKSIMSALGAHRPLERGASQDKSSPTSSSSSTNNNYSRVKSKNIQSLNRTIDSTDSISSSLSISSSGSINNTINSLEEDLNDSQKGKELGEGESEGQMKLGKVVLFGTEKWDFMICIMLGIQKAVEETDKMSFKDPITEVDCQNKINLTLPLPNSSMIAYAPRTFGSIRQRCGITVDKFLLSIGIRQVFGSLLMGELNSYTTLVSEGKSGSFFYFTHDGRFMVKTISESEKKTLLRMLLDYHDHIQQHRDTLLARMYGLFELSMDGIRSRFIVMGNVFDTTKQIHQRFDLKGSSVGRTVGEILESTQQSGGKAASSSVVFRDLDFINMERRINVGPRYTKRLKDQVKLDSNFLQRNGIIDYSLLIGIHKTGKDILKEQSLWIEEHKARLRPLYDNLKRSGHEFFYFDHLDFHQFCVTAFRHSTSGQPVSITYKAHKSLFQSDNGGMQSYRVSEKGEEVIGEEIIFVGIIDTLVAYEWKKQSEHLLKSAVYDGDKISVVPPMEYGPRFVKFMHDAIE